MKPIIHAHDLSKRYTVGTADAAYSTLRETISGMVRAPFKRFGGHGSQEDNTIWALKDLNFEVAPGEVVGIIGRNGAGKSTLLKILSRITEPTTGEVDLYGRVASLLEVGTGFHPELTGRENIFLNGSILGMKRAEIDSKFDEIVSFSEVERFLDTPVKRYSSGMYVRLAFAVAAHLEPEILIVDEVLAVGDAAFQKKCIGKMSDVARHGRTVLFVSHNMVAVKSLCSRAILLNGGLMELDGGVDQVVGSYLRHTDEMSRTGIIPDDAPRLYGTDEAKLRSVRLTDLAGNDVSQLYLGQPCRVEMYFEVFKDIAEAIFEIGIVATDGVHAINTSSIDGGRPPVRLKKGKRKISVELTPNLLPRDYSILVAAGHFSGTTVEWIERALDFSVLPVAESGSDSYRWSPVRGYVRPPSRWFTAETDTAGPQISSENRLAEDLVLGGSR